MKQNIVFLPSSIELVQELHKLGLSFVSIRLSEPRGFWEDKKAPKPYLMIATNQLKLAKQLANKHNINCFYISDSRRKTYRLVQCGDNYLPTLMGDLSQSTDASPLTGGSFCLIVTEDNKTYYYSTHKYVSSVEAKQK